MPDLNIISSTHHDTYPFISPNNRLKDAAENRIILITGAGGGIGLATAASFAQASATTIVLVGRTAAKLEQAKKALSSRFSDCTFIAEQADVADEKDVDKLFKRLQENGIEVDVLVNNAGVSAYLGPIKDCSIDAWWQNYVSVFRQPYFLDLGPHDEIVLTFYCFAGSHAQRPTNRDQSLSACSYENDSSSRAHDLLNRRQQYRSEFQQLCFGQVCVESGDRVGSNGRQRSRHPGYRFSSWRYPRYWYDVQVARVYAAILYGDW